ncbi:DsbA family protein [Nitratireductor basaltis]|uniref:DSBA oxidoreductase n=1 Tax=Nitratireductor basaltis TaxID=472175 RepID=A0A084UAQ0_9HYPH|nr:DsbA family protein [Nitratireductor basaltis]KFB10036.1 DSBA oxidoreductase [Nitratireductor basaltis]
MTRHLITFGTCALLALSTANTFAQDKKPETREDVETIVREYLLENPEILLEMQTVLEQRQQEQQAAAQSQIIEEASSRLFESSYDGVIGNPDASVTVVEFFDYNCGYCKRALADMEAIVAENDDVKFVLKEFPILGPDSQRAHVVSMAFQKLKPEAYEEFHSRLLGLDARADEAAAMTIAKDLGGDEDEIREAMKDPKIMASFSDTFELANALQITGTPSYVVGTEVVFGALGKDVLAEKIEQAAQ